MKKLKVYIATRADGASVDFVHPEDEPLSLEEVARELVLEAGKQQTLVPNGRRGASHLERLAEYGYTINSIETVDAPEQPKGPAK